MIRKESMSRAQRANARQRKMEQKEKTDIEYKYNRLKKDYNSLTTDLCVLKQQYDILACTSNETEIKRENISRDVVNSLVMLGTKRKMESVYTESEKKVVIMIVFHII